MFRGESRFPVDDAAFEAISLLFRNGYADQAWPLLTAHVAPHIEGKVRTGRPVAGREPIQEPTPKVYKVRRSR